MQYFPCRNAAWRSYKYHDKPELRLHKRFKRLAPRSAPSERQRAHLSEFPLLLSPPITRVFASNAWSHAFSTPNSALRGILMFTQTHSSNNVAHPGQVGNCPIIETKQRQADDGTSRLVAEMYAARKADECGIPQTIFKNEWTAGWWHTNPFASVLSRSKIFITILPARYFQ